MGKKPNYTDATLKKLFSLSAGMCSFPNCNKKLVSEHSSVESNICHIEALNPDGKRYNESMTDIERNSYPNLIVLCITHHEEVDKNPDIYTIEHLNDIKSRHEKKISEKLTEKLLKYNTVLAETINVLSNIDIEKIENSSVINPSEPEEKISYNDVKSYKPIIEVAKVFQGRLNTIYKELEMSGICRISNLFGNINLFYLEAKINILGDDFTMENIRKNSDDLLYFVENKLLELIDKSPNKNSQLDIETISFGIKIILVDAFLRCKILEAVKNDNQ